MKKKRHPKNNPLPIQGNISNPSSDEKKNLVAFTKFQGPLPPPQQFKEYDQVSPGTADRIMKMAENEQQFVYNLKSSEFTLYKRAQTFTFLLFVLITIVTFGSGILFYFFGDKTPSYFAFAASFISITVPAIIRFIK